MVCRLELDREIEELTKQLINNNSSNNSGNVTTTVSNIFAEFDESSWSNLLLQGLGAGTAGIVTGFLGRFLPIPPALSAIATGFLIKRFIKNNLAKQYAHGLMIAGIGNLVAGFVGNVVTTTTGAGSGSGGGSPYPYPVR